MAREQVQKAERGRIANRPRFREMIEKDNQLQAPFEVILLSIKLCQAGRLLQLSRKEPTASKAESNALPSYLHKPALQRYFDPSCAIDGERHVMAQPSTTRPLVLIPLTSKLVATARDHSSVDKGMSMSVS